RHDHSRRVPQRGWGHGVVFRVGEEPLPRPFRTGRQAVRRGGVRSDAHGHREGDGRSEEHTSELQSLAYLVCRLLLEKKRWPAATWQRQIKRGTVERRATG